MINNIKKCIYLIKILEIKNKSCYNHIKEGCGNVRLFIAVNFDEKTKAKLYETVKTLKNLAVKGNFTVRENLHLTLVFIGETTPAKLKDIKHAIDEVKAEKFGLSIYGLGHFKRLNGDIIWVGIDNDRNSIPDSIYKQLYSKLTALGFDIEDSFKPHLTLGREVILNNSFNKIEFDKSFQPIFTEIGKISLMQSEKIDGKLIYTEIYSKELL